MRAYRAVWSPFGAHDQRKRPHKLPDQAVKELAEGEPPPGRDGALYTRECPDQAAFRGRAGPGCPPGPAGSTMVGRDSRARSVGTREGGNRGGKNPDAGLPAGDHGATPGAIPPAWHGRSDATPRPPLRVRSQFAVAMAVRAVRSSFASNGSALDRKSSIYPSANGAACGSLTLSGSRWAPRTRNS